LRFPAVGTRLRGVRGRFAAGCRANHIRDRTN
jgi:hypothetical protein